MLVVVVVSLWECCCIVVSLCRLLLDGDDHDTQMEASEREQNNEDIRDGSQASEREQNNEEVCGVSVSARDQNNENIRDGSEAHDQNNTDVLGANPQFGGKNGKQMTYRGALIGLDDSEPSSDL